VTDEVLYGCKVFYAPLSNCPICDKNASKLLFKIRENLMQKDVFNIVQCQQCKLIYVNPQPDDISIYYSPEKYHGFFIPDSHRKIIETETNVFIKVKNILKKITLSIHYGYFQNTKKQGLNKFLKFITFLLKYRFNWIFPKYRKNGKILDVGCAGGDYLKKLQELGWDVWGVDISAESIIYAKQVLGLTNVYTGEFETMELPKNYFDVVTFNGVFEHMQNPTKCLTKCHDVLKPGGEIILTLPSVDGWDCKLFGKFWCWWEAPRHLFFYSRTTIKNLLNKNSFEVKSIEYSPEANSFLYSLTGFLSNILRKRANKVLYAVIVKNRILYYLLLPVGLFFSKLKMTSTMTVIAVKK